MMMGLSPAGMVGLALAVGLGAAAAGGLVYFRPQAPEATAIVPDDLRAGDPAQTTTEPGSVEAPHFDVLRVSPDGSGLAAGRAPPGARVRLRSEESTLAEVEADASGKFAALFRADPSEVPQMLSLEVQPEEGPPLRSEQFILLLPPASGEGGTGTGDAGPQDSEQAAAEGDGEEAEGGTEEIAAAAILEPNTAAEVAAAGAEENGVSLASIEYAEDGSVRLAGAAPEGSRLRIYVDGVHAGDQVASESGRWEASLTGLDEGVYRIRVDALGEDGEVLSRVETPFQRTFPASGGGAGTVTVQPGNNLWTIARTRYGSGMLYTQIFTANADLIADPDLIYPGQIFVLPEMDGEGGGPASPE